MNSNVDYRAYLVHLQAQHEGLRKAVQAVLECLTPNQALPKDEPSRRRLVEELQQLRERLQTHCCEEEEGGCLEEAVARCPRLGASLRFAEQEHHNLIARLDKIITLAGNVPNTAAGARRLQWEFRRFADALLAHESEENRIVQHGFNAANAPEDFE